MKRDGRTSTDIEPHVFDQTNGLADSGASEPHDEKMGKLAKRAVAGMAMLSTQRP